MTFISGAEKEVSCPSLRKTESSGQQSPASSPSPSRRDKIPATIPDFSASVSGSIFGMSSGSPSTSVDSSRGSIILSVMYQPTRMISRLEAVVNQ